MRRHQLWLVALLGVAGCAPTGDPNTETPVPSTIAVNSTPPGLVAGTLALIKDEDKVQVGSKIEDALSVFPKPLTQALSVNALPKGFPSEAYSVDGWESDDGAEGFGVIATTVDAVKRVAVAIRRTRVDSHDAADAVVAAYKSQLGTMTFTTQVSGELTYTFWEDNRNSLMILEAPVKNGKWQLTLALGVKSLLAPIHADYGGVKADIVSLARQAPDATKAEPSKP